MADKKGKSPKTIILGFSIPVFGIIVTITLMQVLLPIIGGPAVGHPLITPLLITMLLAAILKAIGKKIPILKDIGGDAILCIIVPSILFTVNFFPEKHIFTEIQKNTLDGIKHLNKSQGGIGFTTFFVSALIMGSFLGMNIKLLKNSFKKFIPLILISLITGALVVGILGYFFTPIKGIVADGKPTISKGPFLDALFYIFIPLASGGITTGIIPLSKVYGTKNDIVSAANSHIFPALLIGGVFSILLSGIIKKLFSKSKFSGNGKLEINNSLLINDNKPTPKSPDTFNLSQFSTGLISIFALYTFSIVIKEILNKIFPQAQPYFPDTIVFIVFIVIIIKLFSLISDYYIKCINQAAKFITVNFISAILVILGSTLEIKKAWVHLSNINFIVTCIMCVLLVALIAGYCGKKLGYYPLEASVIAGLCTNSIGGVGNIAILSASDLMELIPFSQITTRIGGSFIVIIASIAYPLIYS
ncbi:2-hydroxycarboxylate transporter family protein ['Fragaria x ananassa' phyllody phytoplasma]|uniref:2-hydroxycarboxylate transporter family protein n=1 Tax='Fragaria x ananassa' phyllody phytoplasma TaxID=2358428 RepID=A0ABS5K399_9MOLU|nr:2-hydroxycarboxylate transporter family protein ['Fragaria x ananassa' phyllody phytoplasma]